MFAAAEAHKTYTGTRDWWIQHANQAKIPAAFLRNPSTEAARNFLRETLGGSHSEAVSPDPMNMTVKGTRGRAKSARRRDEALQAAHTMKARNATSAAEFRRKQREALRSSKPRSALYYKLMGEIENRPELSENQREAMRSAVLLGRMNTPDIMASLQMPDVFEDMALEYYHEATGMNASDILPPEVDIPQGRICESSRGSCLGGSQTPDTAVPPLMQPLRSGRTPRIWRFAPALAPCRRSSRRTRWRMSSVRAAPAGPLTKGSCLLNGRNSLPLIPFCSPSAWGGASATRGRRPG